jgi:hypothetical protein
MNLILAILWLLGGIAVLAYEHFTGDVRWRIRGTDLSIGWLLLVLAGYNLARWWSLRSYRVEQQARALQRAQAKFLRAAPRERRDEPPDPNFNFTDEPPPPADRNITDRPPEN